MKWMLTGGAGYIGSHVARALLAGGRQVVVLDDLSTGLTRRLPPDVEIVRSSVLDLDPVTLERHRVDGVIHLAGKKSVSESVARPAYYYRENVTGLQQLLTAMHDAGVPRLVFSSSAAVYGGAHGHGVAESAPTEPVSPYGWTKLAGEDLIRLTGHLTGMHWLSLRYFNVAGAASSDLADTAVSNLIPMVFRALDEGRSPQIFGDDYPTSDGSCVRDYIHVADLADAHVAAAAKLEQTGTGLDAVYNIGTGVGASVKEVLSVIRHVTGQVFDPETTRRRDGDPAAVVARVDAAREALGWSARHDLNSMIESAWTGWLARAGADGRRN